MPELAEVDYFRKQWDPGLGQKVLRVELHGTKRIFRGTEIENIKTVLTGSKLLRSEANGKQMMFHFSGGGWLGIHLGMTGELRLEDTSQQVNKHDHLVLAQAKHLLVFADARMFGRVQFHHGELPPEWWSALPPAIISTAFTEKRMAEQLQRRARSPIKAVLLDQAVFPGVGNWMADEILWQAKIQPGTPAGALGPPKRSALWKIARAVCRKALQTIGVDWGDPPRDWLIHYRWKAGGQCPRDGDMLRRETIAGRTTAWCERCQPQPVLKK